VKRNSSYEEKRRDAVLKSVIEELSNQAEMDPIMTNNG